VRFGEGGVGGDRDGGAFLPLGEDLEQQLGAAAVELEVAELVGTLAAGTRPPCSRASQAGFGRKSDHIAGSARAWLTTAQAVIARALPAQATLFSGLLSAVDGEMLVVGRTGPVPSPSPAG